MSKIVLMFVLLLAAGCAYGQDPWYGLDTLTRGNFDDINPQVDHAGLGILSFGLSSGPLTDLPPIDVPMLS